MLVSLRWLREYVDLPAGVDVDDLAHRLTMASSEVEGIRRVGEWDHERVRVGRVLAVDPHPNADRLRLATVEDGSAAPLQVVCGAPNLAAGQHIAFAREGASLIDGHTGKASVLKRSSIRGVESSGMVLSEAELGLSLSHEGILVLPEDAPVGMPLADYLGDVIIDVHTWPNRADTMSITGIAREVAAILGAPFHLPDTAYREVGGDVAEVAAVRIEEPELCARYIAGVVEGVRVGPSPEWLQERLRVAGMRPINNVVDVTNFVMLELGQPLHAFDLATLRGPIVVRRAQPGETLRTLDGEDRALRSSDLLITDESGPIALAGVMGGAATEVSDTTTRVLLEAARFDPPAIRRTSTRLKLRSEASSRFERGLSPELALHAARRAMQLLAGVCGGTVRRGLVDVYPVPHVAPTIAVPRARLDMLIGFHVPDEEAQRGLRALGFSLAVTGDGYAVTPPWWRTDVSIADDVIEEVLRLAGYDRLPATTLSGQMPPHEPVPILDLREQVQDALAAAGLTEVITYALSTEPVLARVVRLDQLAAPLLRLQNTLSADHEVLRPSLRHSILQTVESNLRAGAAQVAIFEAARVYLPRPAGAPGFPQPDEREHVAGALCGVEFDRWGGATGRELDFFDVRGVIEALGAALGIDWTIEAAEEFGLLPGRTAALAVNGERAGVLGEVHPDTLRAFGLNRAVLLFELDLQLLLPLLPGQQRAVSPPRFPAVEQDLAVVVDDAVTAEALRRIIIRSPLVTAARVFDVYRGDQLAAGKKSVAFAIRYQAPNRTLTTEDANKEQGRIIERLRREHGAEVRG